jgi:hypothetical protein
MDRCLALFYVSGKKIPVLGNIKFILFSYILLLFHPLFDPTLLSKLRFYALEQTSCNNCYTYLDLSNYSTVPSNHLMSS